MKIINLIILQFLIGTGGCTTNFPLDAFALLYFAFSLSFFQREGCPWDRVSLYWQSLKDEKGNLSYTLLNILGQRNKIFINYSNGESKKLTIQEGEDVHAKDSYLQSVDKIILKAFERLNSQYYELTGMLITPAHYALESGLREYYFKKPKGK